MQNGFVMPVNVLFQIGLATVADLNCVTVLSSGLLQNRKSAIHGLPIKSSKSDSLRIRNEYSAHAQNIGLGQSSRSLSQARRIVGSGDENGRGPCRTTEHRLSSITLRISVS